MTTKELNQYRSICREISGINIELKSKNIHETIIGSDSEYPYTQHVISVDGVKSDKANTILMWRLHKCLQLKGVIEAFIYSIEDSLTRQIFILRYIKGEFRPSWVKVANDIGGGNTADGVRMIHARYMSMH